MTSSSISQHPADISLRIWSLNRLRPRFGQLARSLFHIPETDLEECLRQQRADGGRIGELFVKRGLLEPRQIQEILRQQARWSAAAVQSVVPKMCFPFRTRLSLCLPAYNEEGVIEDTLDAACAILPEVVEEFEIVVANDGSKDRTGEILEQYSQRENRVRVVTNQTNLGYGGAVSGALRAATGDLVCFTDSDGQMNFLDLPRFLYEITTNDVVIGFRHPRADHWLRCFNSWAWKRLIQAVLRLPVRDLDCAFKLFHAETIKHLQLTTRGNAISAEIVAQCARANLRIAQVPVEHLPRIKGAATGNAPSVVLRAFRELPKLIKYRWSAPEGLRANETREMRIHEAPLSVCMLAACPFPANYGTPGSIRELAEAVAERGHEVHVVTYPMGEDLPLRGVHLHRISSKFREPSVVVGPTWRKPFYDLQMVFKTLEVIRSYRPAVLHAHGYEAALAASICRMVTGIPIIYSGHHTMADELHTYNFLRPRWLASALGHMLDRIVPALADRCIPHSKNMEDFFRKRGLSDRTEPVVNFGINLRDFAAGDGQGVRSRFGLNGAPVVLYAGLLDSFQRLDLLLDAMPMVVRYVPDAKLLVVTNVSNPPFVSSFLSEVAERGLTGNVLVTDPQPLHAIPEILSAADVTVVPRPCVPGFPIKLLNYMAARKASVLYASSASGMSHREHAYLASPDTSQALADGILEVLSDHGLRERLEQGGHAFVSAHHDRRLIAMQLWEAYMRTILGDARATRQQEARTTFIPRPAFADAAAPFYSETTLPEEVHQ